MGDKISAEVRRMAENRYPAFDNTQKFIEIGYNIAYYRKHAGLTQELDLLFNIAAVLDIEPAKLLIFRE